MSTEPESLILRLLRDMRAEVADMHGVMATKSDIAGLEGKIADLRDELKSDMHSLRADVASDLMTTRKELGEQIVGLRRAVVEYHTTTIGHRS